MDLLQPQLGDATARVFHRDKDVPFARQLGRNGDRPRLCVLQRVEKKVAHHLGNLVRVRVEDCRNGCVIRELELEALQLGHGGLRGHAVFEQLPKVEVLEVELDVVDLHVRVVQDVAEISVQRAAGGFQRKRRETKGLLGAANHLFAIGQNRPRLPPPLSRWRQSARARDYFIKSLISWFE